MGALGVPATALVIGGGSDLATELLCRLAPRGVRSVLLAGPRQETLDASAERLREAGVPEVSIALFDVRDVDVHDQLLDETARRHGSLGLIVVAAGALSAVPFADATGHMVADLLETTFVGPAAFITNAAARMGVQGGGLLVVFTSVAGMRVRLANLAYGAAKAGLDGFCQGVQDALHATPVRLMIVRPGFVHTKMTEGRRPAPLATSREVVADRVLVGLDRGRLVVWAPASLRAVFSLFAIVPRSLWRRIDR